MSAGPAWARGPGTIWLVEGLEAGLRALGLGLGLGRPGLGGPGAGRAWPGRAGPGDAGRGRAGCRVAGRATHPAPAGRRVYRSCGPGRI
jgi:hypothetical protein